MTVYGFIVLIHVISAVVGLGASFAMPTVMNHAKTTAQARHSILLYGKIEKFAKVGSILLLLTGLVLGFLNTALFTTGWYITSIVIYMAVQIIVAGIMPKKMKQLAELLYTHEGEQLPATYQKIHADLRPYNFIIHTAAVVLIVLMSIKPF